jgi:hypothetical protein
MQIINIKKKLLSNSFLINYINCQILGSVNGHNCLELKDKNGCYETWINSDIGQIYECPTEPLKTYYCKDGKDINLIINHCNSCTTHSTLIGRTKIGDCRPIGCE